MVVVTFHIVDSTSTNDVYGVTIYVGGQTGTTDSSGKAEFVLNGNTDYPWTIIKTGYVPRSDTFTTGTSNVTWGIEISPAPLGAVALTAVVEDSYTGNSIAGATIRLGTQRWITDVNGEVLFYNLNPNTDYSWSAIAAGYANESSIVTTGTADGSFGIAMTEGVNGGVACNSGIINVYARHTVLNRDNPITSSGKLVSWCISSNGNGLAKLKIFRDDGINYVFIRETSFVSVVSGWNVDLPCDIDVQEGDLVACYLTTSVLATSGGNFALYNLTDISETKPKSSWGMGSSTLPALGVTLGTPIGNIYCVSNPSGAQIWFDGVNTGLTTPNTLVGKIPGIHSVTIKKSGYNDCINSVEVISGAITDVNCCLNPPNNQWGIENNDTSDGFGDDWSDRTLCVNLPFVPSISDKIIIDFKARIAILSTYNFDFFGNYVTINDNGGYQQNLATWGSVVVSGTDFRWYRLTLPASIYNNGIVNWKKGINKLRLMTWSAINPKPGKIGVDTLKILTPSCPDLKANMTIL